MNLTLEPLKFFLGVLLMTGALGLAACEEEGPAEKAGKELDKAAEEVGEALKDAGEAMEDAAKQE